MGRRARGPIGLYTPARHKKIVRSVRKGLPLGVSGQLAGLGKDTLHEWIAKGRYEPEKYPQYVKLLSDIEKARAVRESEHVAKIEKVALSEDPKTWTAAAWFLERTNPDDWGRKDRMQVQHETPLVQVNQVVLNDQGAREASRDLLRRATSIDASAHESVGPGVRSESEEL